MMYFKDGKPISRELEHELALEYKATGSPAVKAKLLRSHTGWVVRMAYGFAAWSGADPEDLFQAGMEGLTKSLEKYDPHSGNRVLSFGVWWVRAYMTRWLADNWSMVKIATTQSKRRLFLNLRKAQAFLTKNGEPPSHDLVADYLDAKVKDVAEMDVRLEHDVSLSTPLGDDADSTWQDMLEDGCDLEGETLERLAHDGIAADVRQKLADVSRMDTRFAIILERRIMAEKPLTLKELGEVFGVSRERVRQLEVRLRAILKARLRPAARKLAA